MSEVLLEHVNMTVSDPDRTAEILCDLFGWRVRWSGASKAGGYTVHVGGEDRYVALYRPKGAVADIGDTLRRSGAVNHLGVLVEDLAAAEARAISLGLETHSHQTYDPGSRFYFNDPDGIEYEVLSYA